eukprot:scaffold20541_cov58-Attheya_sp.AAC.6
MSTSPQLYQLWASKQVTRFCATGRMMLTMKMWDNDRCPCCKAVEETTKHILTCPYPNMADCFALVLEDLEIWLDEHETHPALKEFLVQYIKSQGTCKFSHLPDLPPQDMLILASDQDEIGWHNCLESKLPFSLYQFQELYLDTLDTRRAITGWA